MKRCPTETINDQIMVLVMPKECSGAWIFISVGVFDATRQVSGLLVVPVNWRKKIIIYILFKKKNYENVNFT